MRTLNPAERLLCELRRLAGETPLSARIKPFQWVPLGKGICSSDAGLTHAVTTLRGKQWIRFCPESTQIIALTEHGIAMADDLIRQANSPQIDAPIPTTLRDIRADLAHWEVRLYEGDPGSLYWEQVKARIGALRHAELRFLQPQPSVYASIQGDNARLNVNSTDQSVNEIRNSGQTGEK